MEDKQLARCTDVDRRVLRHIPTTNLEEMFAVRLSEVYF